jgi:hypothetical protein
LHAFIMKVGVNLIVLGEFSKTITNKLQLWTTNKILLIY